MKCIISLVLAFLSLQLSAQKIVYSKSLSEDNSGINFEILGKVGKNYLIFKDLQWKHLLAVYDDNMQMKDNIRLNFIPEKALNVDFVIYPEFFYIVYQYQRRNTLWCKAVKMNSSGQKLSEPVTLDTSRTNFLADKKIYNTVFSEDKKRMLVYKMIRKNDNLTIVSKLYDADMNMLDSTRQSLPFDERRDLYSDIFLDNTGTFILAREHLTGWRDNVTGLDIIIREPKKDSSRFFSIPLQGKFIDEVKIRIDNLNRNYIINSFFSKQKNGGIDGLFTAVMDANNQNYMRTAFNLYDDSLRSRINSGGRYSTAFDNLFLRNIFVKKDGGFVITAEDFFSQTTTNNRGYRRYDNLYNSPYSSNYDYYLNSPTYRGFYRPYSNMGFSSNIKYNYDDIVILSIDSSLKLTWSTIIHKKQEDVDQDNFLSFANVNAGGEIHFLFTDSKKNQLVNNHSILPGGQIKRYATLKSREAGYEFMPKLARQVGVRQVIMPCLYRNQIAFAKIDFSE